MEPHAVLLAQAFDVAAGKDAAGKVPVVDLPIHDDPAGSRQDAEHLVLGLRGPQRGCTQDEYQ